MNETEAALLRWIASPEVSGIPGACGDREIGPLLLAGFVTFGFAPLDGDNSKATYANAWVAPTEAGLAWIEAHPAPVAP
jgi:hypothetical protein